MKQLSNEELFTSYLAELKLRLRNAKNLKNEINLLIKFKEGLEGLPPSPDLAKSFLSRYTEKKSTTLHRYASTIRSFMKWYGEPIDDFTVKIPKSLPPYIEDDEIDALLTAIKNKKTHRSTVDRDVLLIELALKTGLRRGELATLKTGDLHLKDKDGKDSFLVVRSGKGEKDRLIPLSSTISSRLKTFISDKRTNERIFGLTAESIGNKIRLFAQKAGLPELHTHSLRHKFATDLVEKGADITSVQHLMGHDDLSSTQVYLSITDKRLRDAVNLLEDVDQLVTSSSVGGKEALSPQPAITIKAINKTTVERDGSEHRDYFSHFSLTNEGQVPAIEMEMVLLDKDKRVLQGHRETVLQPRRKKTFEPTMYLYDGQYYVVCQYHAIGPGHDVTWSQTWLPIRYSRSELGGASYVVAGELEFRFGLSRKELVEVFTSRPK